MRIFFVSLVLGIMAFMLLFSGGMSVGAIPNTPTSTPIPAYFNITGATVNACSGAGGGISYVAAVHVPWGVSTLVEWTGTLDGSGDVIDGSRTISTNGNVRGTAYWWADDNRYFEYSNGYTFYVVFRMYRYLSPETKILLDTAVVGGACTENGSSIFLIDNSPE